MLFEPKSLLKGDKIYLEKPQPTFELAEKLFNLIEDNRLYLLPWVCFIGGHFLINKEEVFKLLLNAQTAWREQTAFTYLIYTRQSDLIGMISAHACEPNNAGLSLKLWIKKTESHKGFAYEAIRLIEKEFFFLGIERLVLSCDINNYKARNLALKADFKYEGISGHAYWNPILKAYCDLIVCAKVNEENMPKALR